MKGIQVHQPRLTESVCLIQQPMQQQHKENVNPQQAAPRRQSGEAASKRHAIYGVLFGKRPSAPAASAAPDKPPQKEYAPPGKELTYNDSDDGDFVAPIRSVLCLLARSAI